MDSGIYAIVHTESCRWYVGQSQDIKIRWAEHRSHLVRGVHHNRHLQNAWNKYGPDAFDFEILIFAPVSLLDDLEQAYLDDPDTSHFNIARDPTAPTRGRKYSLESRARMSAANRGRPVSAETRAKIGAANRGRVRSAEARAKTSLATKGRKLSAAHIAQMRGRTHSPEARAKISESKKGLRPRGISGFKGVSFKKSESKWVAKIQDIYLGRFESPEAAARAYDAKARELYGASAYLNFPDESD